MANGEEDGHGEGSQQKGKDNDGFTTVPVKNSSSNTQTLSSRGRKNRKGKNAASPPKNLVTLVEERAQELRRDGYPERCLCARALRSVLTHLTHLMIIPSRLPSCAALLQDARPHLFASTSCRRCICFGLGSLRDSPQSQLQLALLQDLLVAFKVCWRPARRAYLLGFSLINQSLPSQLDEPLLVVDPAFAEEDETFFVEQGYRISPYSVSDATASRGGGRQLMIFRQTGRPAPLGVPYISVHATLSSLSVRALTRGKSGTPGQPCPAREPAGPVCGEVRLRLALLP
jgi:hypothetical protein